VSSTVTNGACDDVAAVEHVAGDDGIGDGFREAEGGELWGDAEGGDAVEGEDDFRGDADGEVFVFGIGRETKEGEDGDGGAFAACRRRVGEAAGGVWIDDGGFG
jgi:hypothetical protein